MEDGKLGRHMTWCQLADVTTTLPQCEAIGITLHHRRRRCMVFFPHFVAMVSPFANLVVRTDEREWSS